jgi:hypothetical protein
MLNVGSSAADSSAMRKRRQQLGAKFAQQAQGKRCAAGVRFELVLIRLNASSLYKGLARSQKKQIVFERDSATVIAWSKNSYSIESGEFSLKQAILDYTNLDGRITM